MLHELPAIFTREHFMAARARLGASTHPFAIRSALTYYCKQQCIKRLRPHVFELQSEKASVNPLLVINALASDATAAFTLAMSLHSDNVATPPVCYYLSEHHIKPFAYQDRIYKAVLPPKLLRVNDKTFTGIETPLIDGQHIRITNRERTLIDGLYYHDLIGWQVLWQYGLDVKTFDYERLFEYASYFHNKALYAKLGFYLSRFNKSDVNVPQALLEKLMSLSPKSPYYIDNIEKYPYNHKWHFMKSWNILVPDALVNMMQDNNSTLIYSSQ